MNVGIKVNLLGNRQKKILGVFGRSDKLVFLSLTSVFLNLLLSGDEEDDAEMSLKILVFLTRRCWKLHV